MDELGFVWDPFETDWAEGFRYLTIYKAREGHCRVPPKHMENGFRLGQWVFWQRQSKDQETLPEARRQQLDELGFVWDPHETAWAEGFRYLTIYEAREGHCRVPRHHKENGFRLGQWVGVQRDNADTLSAPRRQQLDELGFVWDPLETDWAEGLRYLTIYKEREGHCRVPFKHIENGFRLGSWVDRKRRSKDQETLPEARRQQLDELGFVWDPHETDWAEGLRYLTIYKEREGHCRVPRPHKENGFRLGQWVGNQRAFATKGILSTVRKQRLDAIGFEWDPFETDWAEGFRYLTIYKEREGHCRVPFKHMENGFRLGPWVGTQRGNADTLSASRRQQLDQLGFVWDPPQTDWAEGFRYLTIYKEREGHCRVPQKHIENGFRLGSWVDRKRRSKDQETLPEARRQQLDELGFVWDPHEADWAEGLRCLTIYKEREGHCRVPQKHIENGFRLGQWISYRRQEKQTLSEARRQQLDELGFVWDPLETDWAEGLRCLTIYKEREGHCRVPATHKENGFRLGSWVDRQRQSKDQETLPEARRQQLDELGFVWDPLETDWAEGLRYLTIYKEREGHCRVPATHKENGFRLGQWVVVRRHSQTLSEARRQQLDELGFVWDPHETDWAEALRCLTIYKEREGHCRVPQKHIENGFFLGRWINYRRQKKQTLSEARRQQLDELGFVWDPYEADWAEGLRCLTIYKEREGHCRVPATHKENGFRLGQWVVTRRHSQTLSEARRQQLDELGFVWDPHEADWKEGLRHLITYREREGHCSVPRGHEEDDFGLGQWVTRQRNNKDRLSEEQRQRLEKLGFVWNVRVGRSRKSSP